MITTTHILLNTAILGRKKNPERNWALILGSFIPDSPMIFYFIVLFFNQWRFAGTGKNALSEFHYRLLWVDWAHSLPLAAGGMLLCLLLKYRKAVYVFAAMALHDLEDLPVHADFVHRHFLPLSNWRFFSPISFWDPNHYGNYFAPFEWFLVLLSTILLWRRGLKPPAQVALILICVFHGLWLLYSYAGLRW